MSRIFDRETWTTVIVPMDHGPEGWWAGIEKPLETIRRVIKGGANALLLRRGLAKTAVDEYAGRAALILRVGCIAPLSRRPTREALTSSVEEAVRLGADAIAYTVFIGVDAEEELRSVEDFGMLADESDRWGIPLLGEVILVRGEAVENPYSAEALRIAARYIAEEGGDIVKIPYTGDADSFRKVVSYTPAPVVIAGGEKVGTDLDVLRMIEDAMRAGARGIAIGRNIWDREDPEEMVRMASMIVRKGVSAEEAYRIVRGGSREKRG